MSVTRIHALWITQHEYSILINAGTSSIKYSSAERNVIPYLKLKGKNKIDVLCISSLNIDEFRNLLYLVGHFQVNKIYIREAYRCLLEDPRFKKIFLGSTITYIDTPFEIKDNPDIRLFLIPDKNSLKTMSVECIYGTQRFAFT